MISYVRPEVNIIGNAIKLIGIINGQKTHPLSEGVQNNDPAYEIDE